MLSIADLINHFGFPVRDLADVLGLSHSQLVNIAKNRRRPNQKLEQMMMHRTFRYGYHQYSS